MAMATALRTGTSYFDAYMREAGAPNSGLGLNIELKNQSAQPLFVYASPASNVATRRVRPVDPNGDHAVYQVTFDTSTDVLDRYEVPGHPGVVAFTLNTSSGTFSETLLSSDVDSYVGLPPPARLDPIAGLYYES